MGFRVIRCFISRRIPFETQGNVGLNPLFEHGPYILFVDTVSCTVSVRAVRVVHL